MAGTWRLALCVVATCLLIPSSASAFGGRIFPSASSTSGRPTFYGAPSYWVAPAYWVMPYYCAPLAVPIPRVIAVPDARPTPAPPSPTEEPPLQRMMDKPARKMGNDPRMPVIITSHSVGGAEVTGSAPLPKDRCRVGFWNLSGREVTLLIDGKSWTLPKNRALTLDLDRQFSWQVEQRLEHAERVPEGQSAHEVVIRN